jgi:hypothetical protein
MTIVLELLGFIVLQVAFHGSAKGGGESEQQVGGNSFRKSLIFRAETIGYLNT